MPAVVPAVRVPSPQARPILASAVADRRVLAVSDNAPYHRSKLHLEWRGQQASAFGLDLLPLYSPDLNPIERVWKLTRQLCLHNVYFAKLDQVCAPLLSNSLTNGASGAVRLKTVRNHVKNVQIYCCHNATGISTRNRRANPMRSLYR